MLEKKTWVHASKQNAADARKILITAPPLPDELTAIRLCEGAVAVHLAVNPLTTVNSAIGPCEGALTMKLAVLELSDIFTPIGKCLGSKTITGKVWGTWGKRINIPHHQ